jgi:hypothetical protein
LRLIIGRAKLVLSSVTLADAPAQALIEIKRRTLSATAGVRPRIPQRSGHD